MLILQFNANLFNHTIAFYIQNEWNKLKAFIVKYKKVKYYTDHIHSNTIELSLLLLLNKG